MLYYYRLDLRKGIHVTKKYTVKKVLSVTIGILIIG